eukprot:gene44625-27934_t
MCQLHWCWAQSVRSNALLRHRTDIEIRNARGLLRGWVRPQKRMPCVIYLHGNCGSRIDARRGQRPTQPRRNSVRCALRVGVFRTGSVRCVTVLLPLGITVFRAAARHRAAGG